MRLLVEVCVKAVDVFSPGVGRLGPLGGVSVVPVDVFTPGMDRLGPLVGVSTVSVGVLLRGWNVCILWLSLALNH